MKLSKKISSDLTLVSSVVSEALEMLNKLSLNEKQLHDVKLSLTEALVNAVKHGNKGRKDLFVHLDIEAGDDILTMTVSDGGEGFDFSRLLDPTRPENIQKLSGRGVFLIRNLMDKVEFSDCGRKIKMIKFFK